LPLPVAPELTLIHVALVVVVQLQPLGAVTVKVPEPPAAAILAVVGEIDGAHGAPACVTVNVSPPMVSEPVRNALEVFAAAAYVTEPLPLPAAPRVIVSHASLLTAVQLQPDAVTITRLVEAAAPTVAEAGEIVELHGTPACVTVNVCPPIVSDPVREADAVFAATV
jgi:hypothetical protein